MHIPWLPILLEEVTNEFKKVEPVAIQDSPNAEEIEEIKKKGLEPDAFDTLSFKEQLIRELHIGGSWIEKRSCSLGKIFIIHSSQQPWTNPPWALWWRSIRLMSPKKPVKIIIFASPIRRKFPEKDQPIEPKHINGGLAEQCNMQSIILHRREETVRTLIHELLHASCSDPLNQDIPFIEADCEAWAEILLTAVAARGNYTQFLKLFTEQMKYAQKQAYKALVHHGVKTPNDYAWRYLTGRLQVWKRLGFTLPELSSYEIQSAMQMQSLRLTKIDP